MELILWIVLIAGGMLALFLLPYVIVLVIALVPYVLALAICWWIFQWLV